MSEKNMERIMSEARTTRNENKLKEFINAPNELLRVAAASNFMLTTEIIRDWIEHEEAEEVQAALMAHHNADNSIAAMVLEKPMSDMAKIVVINTRKLNRSQEEELIRRNPELKKVLDAED